MKLCLNRTTAFFGFCRTFVCCVIALIIWLVATRVATAQTTTQDWDFSYQAFNILLQESDLEICSYEEWFNTSVDEKIAIVIGNEPIIRSSEFGSWTDMIRGVPALIMSSQGTNLKTQFRPTLGLVDRSQSNDFYSSEDCPIVRPNSTHEVFLGVRSIVCNNPGYISQPSWQQTVADVQAYPPTISPGDRGRFRQRGNEPNKTFSALNNEPIRRIWVADPLLFTNQMVFKADNLRFADNTMNWLSNEGRRKKVLLIINGNRQAAVDPNDLDILTPIPSHDEVIDAVSKLPTKELAKFANSVVQLSEDENVLNDIALKYTDNLKDAEVSRFVLIAIFTCCCAFGLISYFWQRRVLRRTASVTASRRRQNLSRRENSSGAAERQAAASMLLNSFCLDVANRRLADWPEFPTPIVGDDQRPGNQALQATNEMADAYWRLRTKPKSYWNKQTLLDLEQSTDHWRQLILDNDMTIATERTVPNMVK